MGLRRRGIAGAMVAVILLSLAVASGAQEDETAVEPSLGQEQAPALAALPLIVLDPGHGGPETGVVGPGGLREAEVVWAVASELKLLLEGERIARVVLTRSRESNPSLAERTALANGLGARLFVSLHGGAAFQTGTKGASVYLASKPGRAGTVALNGSPPESFRPTRRPSRPSTVSPVRWEATHLPHRAASRWACVAILAALTEARVVEPGGLHEADLPVLQGAAMPACLIEIATLTHPAEEATLRQASTRQALANTLSRGVRAALEAGR